MTDFLYAISEVIDVPIETYFRAKQYEFLTVLIDFTI